MTPWAEACIWHEVQIEKAKAFAASIEKKLSNEKFVSGAPEAVVNAERTKLATQMDIIAKNEAALKELKRNRPMPEQKTPVGLEFGIDFFDVNFRKTHLLPLFIFWRKARRRPPKLLLQIDSRKP